MRNSANYLDELLKEIINTSIGSEGFNDFNVQYLFQKLFEKIRANHPSIKILIVSWITFLDSIPELKLINVFHELLPGLFNMICDKTKDVNQCADKCLKHFLKEIETNFETLSNTNTEVIKKILEIIIEQCKTTLEGARVTAFEWILMFLRKYHLILTSVYNKSFNMNPNYYIKVKDYNKTGKDRSIEGEFNNLINISAPEFVFKQNTNFNINNSTNKSKLDNEFLENYSSDNKMIFTNKSMLAVNNILSIYNESNIGEKLPFYLFPKILEVILINVNSPNEQVLSFAHSCNQVLTKMIDYFSESKSLNVKQFEEVLKKFFDAKKEFTLDIVLVWLRKLFRKFHDEMFTKIELFIESFTNVLSEANENVY